MSRSRAVLAGSVSMAVQVLVRMVGVAVVGRLLSRMAGGEMLGAYSSITQLILIIQLLELGLSQAILRDVAQNWDRPGGEAVRTVLPRASVLVLLLIGVAMAVALGGAAASLPWWFRARPAVLRGSVAALALAAAYMPLRFPLSFFSLFLFARQRLSFYSGLTTVSEALRVALTVLAVWTGQGLPGMMLATITAEIVNFVVAWYAVRRDLPLRSLAGAVSRAELVRLVRVGVPIGMISLGERLGMFSQDLVVGAVAGARAASEFYSTRMPGFLLNTVMAQLLFTVAPGLNDLYGRGLHDAFRRANLRLVGYAAGVGLFASAGIVVFTPAIVSLWVGPSFYMGLPVTGAVGLIALVAGFNSVCSQFAIAVGRTRGYSRLVLAEGFAALGLSFAAGRVWGASHVMWGSAAVQCVSVPYLAGLCGELHGMRALPYLRTIAGRAARFAGLGVAACAGYAVLARGGVAVPPLVGLVAAMAAGAYGCVRFGLFPEDRALLGAMVGRWFTARVAGQHG